MCQPVSGASERLDDAVHFKVKQQHAYACVRNISVDGNLVHMFVIDIF